MTESSLTGDKRHPIKQRLAFWVAAALILAIVAVAAAIIWSCNGQLIYSLDDPYISLSLGRHIAHGEYGINAGENASPASSILYPLLLAMFGWASWQEFVPFAVNAGAAIATALLFVDTACRYGIVRRREHMAVAAVAIVVLCLALNTVGLVFVGLEHSLHALTSVIVVLGLARTIDDGKAPLWLLAAIVLLPLWRFEGCALAILGTAALAVLGQRRAALLALSGIVVTIGAYVLAMRAMGLPMLPSSVLSKSAIAKDLVDEAAGPVALLQVLVGNLARSLNREATPIFALIALTAAYPLLRALRLLKTDTGVWGLGQETVFASTVAGGLAAHVLFGNWGAFVRYSGYAAAFGAAGALILWHQQLARVIDRRRPVTLALGLVLLLEMGLIYLVATVETPVAARGIYEQQYQMHRFVVERYRRPVAVNDLGWVSYRNPYYVLDLWGLGSETARQAMNREAKDPDWIDRLARAHHIELAMIYADHFAGRLPAQWQAVAVLHAQHYIAPELRDVTFYATSADAVPPALAALRAFRPDIAADSELTLFDDRANEPTAVPSLQ